jgi:hypothetical protein
MPEITHLNFIGIDPGRQGGIALMSGDEIRVWPMPEEQCRGIDLRALMSILFGQIPAGKAKIGLEWNTARPGEVPDFAMRFGIQSGELRALCFARWGECDLIFPQVWKLKLGLRGKVDDPHSRDGERYFLEHYPQWPHLIYESRGGLLDGILDALLICHYLKMVYSSPIGKWGIRKPPRVFGLPPEE